MQKKIMFVGAQQNDLTMILLNHISLEFILELLQP